MTLQTGYIGSLPTARSLALQLQPAGYTIVVFDPGAAPAPITTEGPLTIVPTLQDLAERVPSKRIICMDLSDGAATDDTLEELKYFLSVGDIVLHTAQAPVEDTVRRAQALEALQINFLDCIRNNTAGTDLPVGGNRFAYNYCEPLLQAIASKATCRYGGRSGAGHAVQQGHPQGNEA